MYQLDHKESWVPKNWCFWTVAMEKTLASPLDSKEIKSVNPKGNQSWIFIGRPDAPILCPPDQRPDLLEKTLMLGKTEGRRRENRGWDGWIASPTQWTWVWASSGSWWWTGKPGVLQFMGLQRVRHDWVNWSELDSHGPTRLLGPWDFPGNTEMGCHFLLHGIFPTQGWNPHLQPWQVDSLLPSQQRSPASPIIWYWGGGGWGGVMQHMLLLFYVRCLLLQISLLLQHWRVRTRIWLFMIFFIFIPTIYVKFRNSAIPHLISNVWLLLFLS